MRQYCIIGLDGGEETQSYHKHNEWIEDFLIQECFDGQNGGIFLYNHSIKPSVYNLYS